RVPGRRPPHRARHVGRDGYLRADLRPRLRRGHRRRRPRSRPPGPEGDRGVSGGTSGSLMPLLEIDNLHVYYGAIHGLKGLSLSVEPGEVVTLIGANGAGKSTTLRSISGLLRPRDGSIRFEGRDLTRLRPEQVVALGVSQVPEGRRIFPNLTVLE